MKETVSVDIAIIGGGIIGLLIAYESKVRFPDAEIAVFDQEKYLGEHSSGRNSGVIHAGLYYPHKSLKHLMCIEGNQLWNKLSSDLDITIQKCGKLIFSTSPNEESKLEDLYQKALKNEVPIRFANDQELSKLKIHVNAHSAISSPSTGILNVSEALSKIRNKLESMGVNVFFSQKVSSISSSGDGMELDLNDYKVSAKKVINCAGHGAISLRENLGLTDLENYIVRGHYLSTTQKLDYHTLFYPIPPDDLKGLGVHSTIDTEGRVKFGPNTEEVIGLDYTPPSSDLTEMKDLVNFYFKNIDREKLFWDYAGCRSKIRLKSNQSIHTDFWIKSPVKNYIECLGIESPGVTAAPAISKFVVNSLI